MDLWRAIGLGAVLFAISLVVNSLAARAIGLDLSRAEPSELPWLMWSVAMAGTVAFGALGALWYFSAGRVAPSAAGGAALGLALITLGIVLDCLVILPLRDGARIMRGYLQAPQYWITLALLLVICTLVGLSRSR